jgi:archaeal type IV pilus assembly protein PilA
VRNDDAVSPVIGVILMVAIVVILAAVIAAFVFGMAGSTQTTKNVGTSVTQNSAGIGVITMQGGNDLSKVSKLSYSIPTASSPVLLVEVSTLATAATPAPTYPLKVGQVLYTAPETITDQRLILTAQFNDGSSQVIFDKTF